MFPFFVSHARDNYGTGIFTSFPSTTPTSEDLILGSDFPFTDEPRKGTLRFSELKILASVFATQANILASLPSTKTIVFASRRRERSPTNLNESNSFDNWAFIASADNLVPIIFGAKALYQWAVTHSLKGGCF